MSFCRDIYEMLCQKYPNRKIYVIGDHHFYHQNIIKYTRNQFIDTNDMNQFIIQEHNKIINEEDIVIFLGDFCFKNNAISGILKQMNGHKYLILGNHDNKDLLKKYPRIGFEEIFLMPVKINNIYLSHEPLTKEERQDLHFQFIVNEFKKQAEATNYHGHIHDEKNSISSNYKNVACEVSNYKPTLIGGTTEILKKEEKPLFINTPYFDRAITYLAKKHSIDPQIFLQDYIYSYILEVCNQYQKDYFIQGSFGLFKKYDYLVKFSDLDFSFLYNSSISKEKNIKALKMLLDEVYKNLNKVGGGVNLNYLKRYSSLCMFDIFYTSKSSYFTECCLDANLIFLDCYKETDFIKLSGTSLTQRFVKQVSPSLLEDYRFPTFQTQFLKPEGDIANLLLQIIFQQGHAETRIFVLKKLQYVYKHTFKDKEMPNLLDIFTRLFLRNIAFFNTMKRTNEVEYIQSQQKELSKVIPQLPERFQYFVADELTNPNSIFAQTYEEICSVSANETFEKCTELVRKLK